MEKRLHIGHIAMTYELIEEDRCRCNAHNWGYVATQLFILSEKLLNGGHMHPTNRELLSFCYKFQLCGAILDTILTELCQRGQIEGIDSFAVHKIRDMYNNNQYFY